MGITGKDWVGETNSDVEPILDLEYGKIRLVIAFPDKYLKKSTKLTEYGSGTIPPLDTEKLKSLMKKLKWII